MSRSAPSPTVRPLSLQMSDAFLYRGLGLMQRRDVVDVMAFLQVTEDMAQRKCDTRAEFFYSYSFPTKSVIQ